MGWLPNRLPTAVAWLDNDVPACRALAVAWLERVRPLIDPELEIMRHWRGAAVGSENWVPRRWCARMVAGRGLPGVISWRRAGRKVHSCAGVPSVVSDCLWTVRGRELDCCRSPM